MNAARSAAWHGAALLVGLAIAPGAAHAQSLVSGSVAGTVTDRIGEPVGGAFVTLVGASGATRLGDADRDGAFRFLALAPGSYEVFAEALGYRPVRMVDIAVGPGRSVTVTIALTPTDPPVTRVDTVPFHGRGTETGDAGASQWFADFELMEAPDAGRALADLARHASFATPRLEVQGLPQALSGSLIDGVPITGIRHPWLPADPAAGNAFTQLAFRRAELITNDVDMERAEYAAGQLSGYWRRGSRRLRARAFGDWSGDALTSAEHFDPPSFSSLRGGLLLSGPIIPDTAHFVLGVEAQRSAVPLGAPWAATPADSALRAVADESFGVDLAPFFAPRAQELERVTAFGRLDWRLGERHGLDVWTSVGSSTIDNPVLGAGAAPNLGARLRNVDVTAGGTLTSVLGSAGVAELRMGFERGDREYRPGSLVATTFVNPGIRLGTEPGLSADVTRTAVRGSATLHYASGSHQMKLGGSFATLSYDMTWAYGRSGEFLFADADAFGRREGVFARATGPEPVARFATQQLGGFIQDTWTIAPGFDFRVGLRYELELIPRREVTANEAWRDRTGIFNDSLDVRRGKFSPRAGFTWALGDGGWMVRGQTGVYYDRIDPALIGELATQSGTVDVSRGVGTLSAWPGVPDGVSAPVTGQRLTILGPAYEAPRSSRASFGVTRFFGRGTALHVSTSYRHTDFLPRRDDLNLLPAASAVDQHGRAVFGTLVQQGALLAAEPGSNRRFSGFDVVSAVNADGYSDYWDVTAGLERRTERFEFTARYTYSRATDNWLGGHATRMDEAFTGLPLSASDWADGTSDFDIPSRLVIGAAVRPFRGHVTLAGLYRYQSGPAFTPGYQAGVDANGDGFAGNDPAYVDANIAGVTDLFAEWDCLRDQSGGFADRNACRAAATGALDLRLAIGTRVAGYPVEFAADVLNVLDEAFAVPDRALYLVDGSASLVTDAAAGTVMVPLVVNPNFGQPIQHLGAGRAVRLGVRVNY